MIKRLTSQAGAMMLPLGWDLSYPSKRVRSSNNRNGSGLRTTVTMDGVGKPTLVLAFARRRATSDSHEDVHYAFVRVQ